MLDLSPPPPLSAASRVVPCSAAAADSHISCRSLVELTSELRSIELIVGERINLDEVDINERDTLAKIQEILYQTEEGFEVPDGEELEAGLDDETF